jgi:hypothetical protein
VSTNTAIVHSTYTVHIVEKTQAIMPERNKMFEMGSDMIYLLTAIGLSPGGSSTVHIYTPTVHRTTKKTNNT